MPDDYGNLTIGEIILIIFAVMFLAGELIFFSYLYLTSDRIECNWILCSFITERRSTTIYKSCYENGMPVNCSEVEQSK